MHDDRSIVEARLRRVVVERIDRAIHRARVPLEVTRWEAPGEPVLAADAATKTYEPFAVGEMFGRPWGTTWFRMSATVPAEWAGETVDAVIDLGFTNSPGFQSEGLLWADDPDRGWIPVRAVNPLNRDVPVGAPVAGGEQVHYVLEAASNPQISAAWPDRNSDLPTASTSPIYALTRAELVVVDSEVAALRQDIRTLNGLMKQLPLDQPRRHEILRALERMLDRLVLDDIAGSAAAARAELTDVLSRPAHASAHRISAIGHAHIDSAWLWPIRETIRKCARTFSNVLALMDRYPEFRFGCSQAVQYEWMREHYPSIFEGIVARVAEGRWLPIGGMWVEADTNLAGGEALIRQITHGQRFFEEHFGVASTEVWIPDVFGYPASLPQIMTTCGIDRFLTQKLSWNKTNRFPHHTFWWEGIDGSTVFTHFPPVETYNANFNAGELGHAVRTFSDKGRATRSLMPFGHGDGGGGPTPQMLEQFRRVRDLEGSPRIEIESPEEFFDAAIAEYPDAPRWVGELYFEMHRGTFTSQAGTKAGNRRCEALLREAELWCVAAYGTDADFPAAALDRLWKIVLLHQFHDILPGSSIGWVHREAEIAYAQVADELESIIAAALEALAGDRAVLANPTSAPRRGVVTVESSTLSSDPAVQLLADGRLAVHVDVPAQSVVLADPLDLDVDPVTVDASDGIVLDNGLLRIAVDTDGLLSSVFDVAAGREVLAPGSRGNLLQLHPDFPNEYDAWDVEEFYRRQVTDLVDADTISVLDDGPLVARVQVVRSFRSSSVTQVLELRAGSRRLDVVTDVDWREHEQLLKVAFGVDVHCDEITREIQFGHLRSAIHTNTSWDAARFEVCAHRWVDASEPGYGVALLNDSKYGYDVTRTRSVDPDGREVPTTTMRLTLLRGARYPDPEADQGRHRFTYSLLPHTGDHRDGRVLDEASWLNEGVRIVDASPGRARTAVAAPDRPVVGCDHPAVVVDAVKAADDGSGDLVVRCSERWGGRAAARLSVGLGVTTAEVVDARERPGSPPRPLAVTDDAVDLSLRPFEIVTVRFRR